MPLNRFSNIIPFRLAMVRICNIFNLNDCIINKKTKIKLLTKRSRFSSKSSANSVSAHVIFWIHSEEKWVENLFPARFLRFYFISSFFLPHLSFSLLLNCTVLHTISSSPNLMIYYPSILSDRITLSLSPNRIWHAPETASSCTAPSTTPHPHAWLWSSTRGRKKSIRRHAPLLSWLLFEH